MSAKDIQQNQHNQHNQHHGQHQHNLDDGFDDFLRGQGDLASLLQSLPQPAPSAELDARILRDAEIALAQDAANSAKIASKPLLATNDPAPKAGLRPPPGFFNRWRYPLGLAATLVLTMSVTLSVWRGQTLQETPSVVIGNDGSERKRVSALEASTESMPIAKSNTQPSPVENKNIARNEESAPQPATDALAARAQAQNRALEEMDRQARQMRELNNARQTQERNNARQIQESQHARQAQESQQAGQMQDKSVLTARARARDEADAPIAAAPPQMAAAPVQQEAHAWFERIEKLLQEGKRKEALEEWKKFQDANPAFVAPAATLKELEALRGQHGEK